MTGTAWRRTATSTDRRPPPRAGRRRHSLPAQACLWLAVLGACSEAPADTRAEPTARRLPASLTGDSIARALGCGSCHADMPALERAGLGAPRLDPGARSADSVFERLRSSGGHPDFHLDDGEAAALAVFLGRGAGSRSLRAARSDYMGVDSAAGRRIFVALNCAGCHDTSGIEPRSIGPLLAFEGSRVDRDWLVEYLLEPRAVRPFGAQPGDGGRMPRFALDRGHADSLASWLLRRTAPVPDFVPATVTPFDSVKMSLLIASRFSCLGCHRIGDRGGRIGPDLSRAGRRLRPAWIRGMIESPAHFVPGVIMPPTPAAPELVDDLASWISSLEGGATDTVRAGYLSLLENLPIASAGDGPVAYVRMCAGCHGPAGNGDGYNARFLAARPAVHTDSAAMSARTDDRLYDAIAAGGRFLDGSPAMPGFAGQLDAATIRGLVQHLRRLCGCAGPAWSGDGGAR